MLDVSLTCIHGEEYWRKRYTDYYPYFQHYFWRCTALRHGYLHRRRLALLLTAQYHEHLIPTAEPLCSFCSCSFCARLRSRFCFSDLFTATQCLFSCSAAHISSELIFNLTCFSTNIFVNIILGALCNCACLLAAAAAVDANSYNERIFVFSLLLLRAF